MFPGRGESAGVAEGGDASRLDIQSRPKKTHTTLTIHLSGGIITWKQAYWKGSRIRTPKAYKNPV